MAVEVARLARVSVSDRAVRNAVGAVLTHEGTRSADVSVAFVGPARMRVLNRTYHGEDRATDVLAFRGDHAGRAGELGEIIICPAVARRNATRAQEPVRREVLRLLIHGTLHLCGYDHARPHEAEEMFTIQERLVERL